MYFTLTGLPFIGTGFVAGSVLIGETSHLSRLAGGGVSGCTFSTVDWQRVGESGRPAEAVATLESGGQRERGRGMGGQIGAECIVAFGMNRGSNWARESSVSWARMGSWYYLLFSPALSLSLSVSLSERGRDPVLLPPFPTQPSFLPSPSLSSLPL